MIIGSKVVQEAEDMTDLKAIWKEIQPGMKDLAPGEQAKIKQLKDERKKEMENV